MSTIINGFQSIWAYAHENVKYYKEYEEKAKLIDLPVIHKGKIKSQYLDFISERYAEALLSGNITIKTTSGSTGHLFEVPWLPQDEYIASRNVWKYRNKWYNVAINDKYLSFASTIYNKNSIINDFSCTFVYKNNLIVNKSYLNSKNINKIANAIIKYEPKWILTQPSVLYILLDLLQSDLSALGSITYIELTGEHLSENLRNYFSTILPNVIIKNMYSTTETNCVALECPYGHMHIIKENCIVETDSSGRILLTSLINTVMPIIRYDIGDRGMIKNIICEGENVDTLMITEGRESDVIECFDGKKISYYLIDSIIRNINSNHFNCILLFNAHQITYKQVIVGVVLKDNYVGWFEIIQQKIIALLNDLCLDIKWEVELLNGRVNLNEKLTVFKSLIK